MNKSELWADPEWRGSHWGNRRGRPWGQEEITQAVTMRLSGHSNAEIAAELGRTLRSVEGKIGYVKS
jgi:hypothetical protein